LKQLPTALANAEFPQEGSAKCEPVMRIGNEQVNPAIIKFDPQITENIKQALLDEVHKKNGGVSLKALVPKDRQALESKIVTKVVDAFKTYEHELQDRKNQEEGRFLLNSGGKGEPSWQADANAYTTGGQGGKVTINAVGPFSAQSIKSAVGR